MKSKKCVLCEKRRKLNYYDICEECWDKEQKIFDRLVKEKYTKKDDYGYLNQKNKYFIKRLNTINFNSGFKSLDQFKKWFAEEKKSHPVQWTAGYSWKYFCKRETFDLVDKKGELVRC